MIEDDEGWNERAPDDEPDDLSDLDEIVRLFDQGKAFPAIGDCPSKPPYTNG